MLLKKPMFSIPEKQPKPRPDGKPNVIIVFVPGGGWTSVGNDQTQKNEWAFGHGCFYSYVSYSPLDTSLTPLTDENPLTQAQQVASGILEARKAIARSANIAPPLVVGVGVSAGANILNNAIGMITRQEPPGVILGAISIDTSAYNIPAVMALSPGNEAYFGARFGPAAGPLARGASPALNPPSRPYHALFLSSNDKRVFRYSENQTQARAMQKALREQFPESSLVNGYVPYQGFNHVEFCQSFGVPNQSHTAAGDAFMAVVFGGIDAVIDALY